MREFVEMRYFSGDSVFWEETVEDFASNTVDRSRLGPCIKAGGRCMKIVRFSIQSSVKRNKVLVVSSRGRVQPDQINMAGFFWYLVKVTCPVYATVNAYTGHWLTFYKVLQKH